MSPSGAPRRHPPGSRRRPYAWVCLSRARAERSQHASGPQSVSLASSYGVTLLLISRHTGLKTLRTRKCV
ncbi:hypothetical protein CBM2634_A80005 [Cupriavidus taiwanensis]|uniref:Uncharacterized protein n=1 Tax=Cupriavidus taiwanensis TaxID=164546 RepID=A0A375J528_9BURK|nr:hypothetical protein CBM2634_A80005 [Cupriavidus taiwanensis]